MPKNYVLKKSVTYNLSSKMVRDQVRAAKRQQLAFGGAIVHKIHKNHSKTKMVVPYLDGNLVSQHLVAKIYLRP